MLTFSQFYVINSDQTTTMNRPSFNIYEIHLNEALGWSHVHY